MKVLKWIMSVALILAISAMGSVAEDALPVEIDIELLRETMTLEEAKERLREVDAADRGLSKSNREQAIAVLEELAEKGIPVETAYNAVVSASEADADVQELSAAKDAEELGAIKARMDVENEAEEKGLKAEDVSAAVEVLEGLIEKGVPVQKAREVVSEAVSEDRDPQALRDMLTDIPAIEEMKEEAQRQERKDKEAVMEKMREKAEERVQDRIQDRIPDREEVPVTPER